MKANLSLKLRFKLCVSLLELRAVVVVGARRCNDHAMRSALAVLLVAGCDALTLPSQPQLTLEAATAILQASQAAARESNWPVSICVCDAGGAPVALSRDDGAFAASAGVAMGKASTAAQFRKPTEALEASANGGRAALLTAGHVLMGGGVPLVADGCTVGGVGVSGVLPDQDAAVAAAGAAAL